MCPSTGEEFTRPPCPFLYFCSLSNLLFLFLFFKINLLVKLDFQSIKILRKEYAKGYKLVFKILKMCKSISKGANFPFNISTRILSFWVTWINSWSLIELNIQVWEFEKHNLVSLTHEWLEKGSRARHFNLSTHTN